MEILQILRNHISTNPPPPTDNIEVFSNILDDTEKQLVGILECQNNELHEDQYTARCFNLEGMNSI